MEGRQEVPEESKGELNPMAADFMFMPEEEVKHGLKADAVTFEPNVIIESYETQPITHCKTAEKFEGRYGMLNFVHGESMITYDPIEDSWVSYGEWTSKAKTPDSKYSRAIMTSPSTFVITGGLNGTALKHSYHVEVSNNFGNLINAVQVYEMQEARFQHMTAIFNGNVYAIGGQNSPTSYLTSVEAFENNSWTQKSGLNKPRSFSAVISNNSAIWVAGGFCGSNELSGGFEKYDGNEWKLIEVSVQLLAGMSVVPRDRFNLSFLVLGGSDGSATSNRVLLFNTENSSFEEDEMKLLLPRAGAATCWYGNSFWVVGGGHSIGEFWSNNTGKKTKAAPFSIYAQIEAVAFMKSKE